VTVGNWGRWGAEDERGALNLLDAPKVREAAGLVTSGRVISLAMPLDERTPVPDGRRALSHHMTRDGGDYAAGGRTIGRSRYAEDVVSMGTHTGTHVDSLAHVWYDEQIYNGHPQNGIRSHGASRCGAQSLSPMVGRGVLIDAAAHAGVDCLPAQTSISKSVLERACADTGLTLRSGDIVLVRTGWLARAGAAYFHGEPGLDASAAAWLAEQDVALVGADNYAIETLDERSSGGFPVHELLLRDCGIPLVENMDLEQLAAENPGEFLFIATPLPLRGATASPLAPIAIL
jgi:kynurenine formamidase